MIKKILTIVLMMAFQMWAANTLVSVYVNPSNSGNHTETMGFCVDKKKRLVLLPYVCDPLQQPAILINQRPCKVVAQDALYGICVVQVEEEEALKNVEEAEFVQLDVNQVYDIFRLNKVLNPACVGKTSVSKDREVKCLKHPANFVYLHRSYEYMALGSILTLDKKVAALALGKYGLVTYTEMKRLLEKSYKILDEQVSPKEYVLAGVCFDKLLSHNKVEVVVTRHSFGASKELEVGDVILKVNNSPIAHPGEVPVVYQDKSVSITVQRKGKERTVKVPLLLLEKTLPKWIVFRNKIIVYQANQALSLWAGVPEGTLLLGHVGYGQGWKSSLDPINGVYVNGTFLKEWDDLEKICFLPERTGAVVFSDLHLENYQVMFAYKLEHQENWSAICSAQKDKSPA